MRTNSPFLTADWKELTLMNFRLEPDMVQSVIPHGLMPDLLEGSAYASLVAFDFQNIRVARVAWPGHTSFPEFNLRVYVRCEAGRRGVIFVRELIPSRIPALIAQWVYNEPYLACPMQRQAISHDDGSQSQYTTLAWNGRISQISVRVGPGTSTATPGSAEDWLKEQEWGFGMDRTGELLRYRVVHSPWLLREVQEYSYDIDWAAMYGPIWASTLANARPASVIHAIGSEVAVYGSVPVARPFFS